MGERKPLVKSHIPGDEIHEKILKFRGRICWSLWRSWTSVLGVFFSLAYNFLSFDLMIWLWYVLIMFLVKKWLKSSNLGSKRRKLGFKRTGKGQKDPWEGCYWASLWPGLTVCRAPDAPLLGLSWGHVQ